MNDFIQKMVVNVNATWDAIISRPNPSPYYIILALKTFPRTHTRVVRN